MMDHKYFNELLVLSVYEELEDDRKQELKLHLQQCETCRAEYAELIKFKESTTDYINPEFSEKFLTEARMELQANIRRIKRQRHIIRELFAFLFTPSPKNLRIAWSAACLMFFLFIGSTWYLIATSGSTVINTNAKQNGLQAQISNIKFDNSEIEKGIIEVNYQKVTPVKVRGSINDPEIQKVLALSLINNDNPGTRLKAVSAVLSDKTTNTTTRMRAALIKAAQYDNNPGVRRTAIKALNRLRFDDEIRDALIYVLMNDPDSGLRILAISSLDENNKINKLKNEQTIEALKTKMLEDENTYIKLRAKSILNKLQS